MFFLHLINMGDAKDIEYWALTYPDEARNLRV